MIELSIVIPIYNEEDGVLPVLDELEIFRQQFADRYKTEQREVEIVLVDDGSTDQTASLLERNPYPKRIITQPNQGYGAALKTGFRVARGRWVGFLDADGTYPVDAFFSMYEDAKSNGIDMVIGSRLDQPSGMPGVRNLGNRSFAALLGVTSGSTVTDIASGMRLLRRERVPDVAMLPDGLDFTPAMTTWALHDEWTIKEIPIVYRERIGDSKLNVIRDGLRFTYDILSISSLYNPLKLFGVAGVALLLAGLALTMGPLLHYAQAREVPDSSIYRLLTALVLWVIGLQSVVCGIVGTSFARLLHRKSLRATGIERSLLSPGVTGRLHWGAALLIGGAFVLNAQGVREYLTNGTVSEHWSRLLAGVVLVLTAVHLLLYQILVAYLGALERRFVNRP